MAKIQSGPWPENSMLLPYSRRQGCYTDCFFVEADRDVDLETYILAFFNTPIFRLERLILASVFSAPSSQLQVDGLASGKGDGLASWRVEKRSGDQLLLNVKNSPIRTWLMVSPKGPETGATRLYFGSAVLPTKVSKTGEPVLGASYRRLVFLHRLYSKILLRAAASKLNR